MLVGLFLYALLTERVQEKKQLSLPTSCHYNSGYN